MALDKEFLESHGLSGDALDAVLKEYNKDITDEQQKVNAEKLRADTAETNYATANEKLKGYDPEWETTVKNAKEEAQKEIEKLKFDYALEKAMGAAKAKNTKAVMALLDMEGLKQNGDEIVGLNEQIEKLKKENDFLFDTEPTPPPFSASTNGEGLDTKDRKDEANAALRAMFGKE